MRRNTQAEKRAEAKRFLRRFEGEWLPNIDTMIAEIKDSGIDYTQRGTAPPRILTPTGAILDDTKEQKKNTKFNLKNPSDSDLLRIILALNVVIILINIFRR